MAMEVGYLRHSTTITNGLCCNCDPKPRGACRVQTRLPGTLCLVKDTFTSSKAKLKKPSQREIFLTSRKRLNQIQGKPVFVVHIFERSCPNLHENRILNRYISNCFTIFCL